MEVKWSEEMCLVIPLCRKMYCHLEPCSSNCVSVDIEVMDTLLHKTPSIL